MGTCYVFSGMPRKIQHVPISPGSGRTLHRYERLGVEPLTGSLLASFINELKLAVPLPVTG